MEGELDPEEAASRYESEIRNVFKLEGAETPTFDMVLLGLGPDGHTASLFPHTEGLDEMARIVMANHVPQKDAWRLTLTWPVITQARLVAFLIEGEDKAAMVRTVFAGEYDLGDLSRAVDPPGKRHADHADGPGGRGRVAANRRRHTGDEMILAGDVGGTKVHLALYTFEQGKLQQQREQKFPAHEFASLEDVVNRFLNEGDGHGAENRDEVTAACFGCPGPVQDGRIKLTNLPWTLDTRALQASLRLQHIFLINDLEANAYGIPELAPDAIFSLHTGEPGAAGHRGLVSAGTGLGEALLIWDGNVHRPVPSEGGHCDFAARNEREIALLRYLQGTLQGRVSFERVVSGMGITNLYSFLRDDQKMDEPAWLKDRMGTGDPNAVIGQCAEDGSSELCFETMQMFSAAYGAESGNVALKVLAKGGVYLGGGIAPKVLKTLQGGAFMDAFLDKGRLRPMLESMPVRVILDDTCALLGAAAYAEQRGSEVSGKSERAASLATQ